MTRNVSTKRDLEGELRDARRQLELVRSELIHQRRLVDRVTEATADVFYVYEVSTRTCPHINGRIENVLGYPAERFLERSFARGLVHPEDAHDLGRTFERILTLQDREVLEISFRMQHADGSFRWLRTRNAVFTRSETGAVLQIFGLAQDVTEERRADKRLRASEERLRTLTESLPQLLWSCNAAGWCTYMSPQWIEYTGTTEEENLGSGWQKAVHPADRDRVAQAWSAAVSEEAVYDIEYRLRDAAGQYRWFQARGVPVRDSRGEIATWFGSCTDVDDLKRTQNSLAESEERFRKLFEQSPLSIQVLAPEGRVLRVNRAWEHLFGGASEKLLDYNILTDPQLLAKGIVPDIVRAFGGDIVGIPPIPYVPEQGPYAGQERWVRAYTYPVKDDRGEVKEVVVLHEDITEHRLAEEALRDADRRKDEFLAMLAHELRNPLAPIRNATQVLRMLGPADSQLTQSRDMIERQVTHMARLVDDLLDVSRITQGKILLRRERLDLVPLIVGVVDDHRPLLEKSGLKLKAAIPATPLWVVGDATRLAQVVGNLLHNANKFTDPGGEVNVHLAEENREAVLRVRDTGIGMDAEILRRIFEPFSQADRSLDRSRGGLGLGLALVKGLLDLHDGSIVAASDGIQRGAEFTLRLPLSEAGADSKPMLSADSGTKQTLKILVIEDNRDSAESLKMLLELKGHDVRVAHAGKPGLELAEEFRPRVVLCDIGLPGGMNGYAVAENLRASRRLESMTLVALSGYGQDEDQRRAREAGFDLHFIKPLDPAALFRLLEGLN